MSPDYAVSRLEVLKHLAVKMDRPHETEKEINSVVETKEFLTFLSNASDMLIDPDLPWDEDWVKTMTDIIDKQFV